MIVLIFVVLFVVREFVNVPWARMILPFVVVVATEFVETLLIKEVAIGIVVALVVRQYVESHVIIVAALDLFDALMLLLFFVILFLAARIFVALLAFVLSASGILVLFLSNDICLCRSSWHGRELNLDFFPALLLFVPVPLFLEVSLLILSVRLWCSLGFILFLVSFLRLNIFLFVFHLLYNKNSGQPHDV
jgi:hypothetical protein